LSKYLGELTTNGYLTTEQVKENGRFSHNVYTLPDIKLPCTKICDTVNLGDGNLYTNNNSSKTNNSSKRNSTKKEIDISSLLENVGYDFSYLETYDLQESIVSFMEFRKSIKKPMTEYAVQLMVAKLFEMTKDPAEAKKIVQQSIMNGWQGIFPLKEQQKKTVPDPIKNRVSNVDNW
jgi:hypothetical protein